MRLKFELLPPDQLEVEPILDIRFTMEFPDPRRVRIYSGQLDGLDLPAPGQYRVTLTAHGATLVQGQFTAVQTTPPR